MEQNVEVTTEIGEEVVRYEHDKHSTEGHAPNSRNAAQQSAEALKDEAHPYDEDEAFHEAFQSAIESTKPLLDDKERLAQEDREQAKADREAQAATKTEEDESDDEQEEDQTGPNPLDQFSQQDVDAFAKHFGLEPEDLENPKIAAMLASRMSDQQEAVNKIQAPIPQIQDEQRFQQHLEGLSRLAQDPNVNDPRMVQAFEGALAQCFDAQTPESMQSVKGLSSAMIQGGISLMSSVVPQMLAHYLPSLIEQYLPGLTETHRETTVANIWSDIRTSNPSYRSLPEVDSPEFQDLRAKVLADNPWMATITFKDGNGQTLHPDHPQSIRQQAALFAKLAKGEQMTPEVIQRALETGRKESQNHSRKVSVSRSVRSGKSTGQAAFRSPEPNDFRDAIESYNQAQRSSEI